MIEWTRPGKDKEKEIRCPYCVQDGAFRLMVPQVEGDWFFCNGCGHLALPSVPFYRCTCGKCASLYTHTTNDAPDMTVQLRFRRMFDRFRRGLGT